MRTLQGRVVVVTGASSGVGRAVARAFGAAGARVALIARGVEALTQAGREIEAAGGEALVLPLDVSDPQAVEQAADAVVQRWGGIDVWVNDAMVSVLSPALQLRPEELQRVTEVNYLGSVYGTLAAVRRMRARGGVVLQIGSALAYRSIPLQSAYCASKAALRAFTDSLRSELLHDRIPVRLCMVHLPAVNTPQFDVMRNRLPNAPQPVPPLFQPEEVARVVLYAALHPRRELWLGWSTIGAIVGQFFVPGLIDRYLARWGYSGQQAPTPAREPRRDNLERPLPGDRGAHGRFDRQSRRFSSEMRLRVHPWLAGALAGTAVAAMGARAWRR